MADPRAKAYPEQTPTGEKPRELDTVRPPFDPEEFARESDSMIRIEAARATAPPPPMSEYANGGTSGTIAAFAAVAPEIVPLLDVAKDDLEWFDLQPVARALLGHVDGRTSVETIAERTNVPIDQAMSVLHELAREGVLTWQVQE
jgi:hypothetical protein